MRINLNTWNHWIFLILTKIDETMPKRRAYLLRKI